MMTYKCKGQPGLATAKETIRRKARLMLRGDLQTTDEFSTVFAPTSKFTTVQTFISLATQENLLLKSWDVQGASMTSEIDQDDIYVSFTPSGCGTNCGGGAADWEAA
mmetsp:Transcript_44690/g.69939  ORF Transcript_44690/g.69939 Transcript_44690/m.69939 type:complete len:107 (+) Transcript_44690:1237-1557(+)